jgi:biotin carboxyl carrier protein
MATRVRLRRGDEEIAAALENGTVRLDDDGGAIAVQDRGDGRFAAGDPPVAALAATSGDVVWVSVDSHVFAFDIADARAGSRGGAARDHDALSPPMPATVVRIAVKAGDSVRKGDLLIALEAMKMELPIRAPRDGIVAAVRCVEGELVQPGTALIELAP